MPVSDQSYAEFFLGSSPAVVQYECVELFHTNFSTVFRAVRNHPGPLTVTQTQGFFLGDRVYTYVPMQISPISSSTDLDQKIKIDFGDLGTLIPDQLDLVSAENGFSKKPIMVYRTYRSDDLTEELFGPIELEVVNIAFSREGASLECQAPIANQARSGELYTTYRFPMLETLLR